MYELLDLTYLSVVYRELLFANFVSVFCTSSLFFLFLKTLFIVEIQINRSYKTNRMLSLNC